MGACGHDSVELTSLLSEAREVLTSCGFIELADELVARFTRLSEVKPDWRIGIGVTPKMRAHEFFRHVGIIRKILPATGSTVEQVEVELFFVGKSERFVEPANDWMTA